MMKRLGAFPGLFAVLWIKTPANPGVSTLHGCRNLVGSAIFSEIESAGFLVAEESFRWLYPMIPIIEGAIEWLF